MRIQKVFFLLIFLVFSHFSEAQLNNTALLQQVPVRERNANELRIEVQALGFLKNNEYFNKIADGYTLFGYQLNPKLSYQPSADVKVEAGALLWKDFGASGYESISPTFTVKVKRAQWELLFGTLEGNLNHGYIEPLYDFERLLLNRLENGIQYKLHTQRLRLDAWVDWVNMLYRGEQEQEQIHGGAAVAIRLLEQEGRGNLGDSLYLTLPLQFTAQHKGGQIDASELPLTTLVNVAVGLELEKKYSRRVLQRLYTMNYLVGFKDFSNELQLPYEQGHGLYVNIGADTKYQDVMLSYWRGDGYISELGGRLYQSASTTFKNPDYLEEERELLILRLMKDIALLDNLTLTLRLEPLVDFNDPKLEFSSGFYLNFNTDFFVARPRQ
ncbi:hypothetical protein [Pontibacter actiniarum]|uniref:hypothetical protein n=1 Tax=Pontibacter actiniarum TaxID=323450 RepID=UPI0003F8794D|nr:hypothetical protein [Pontibacter actiniarum]